MKKTLLTVTLFVLIFSFFPKQSEAHSGALDKLGGHFNNSNCSYLLHKPTALAKTAKTKSALLSLIKTYSSNKCKNTLTVNKILTESTYSLPNTPVVAGTSLNTKYSATLSRCIDGDTAEFRINGKAVKSRFLFIDTPEYTTTKERFGKEASAYTCNRLKKAKKMTLELDGKDKYDKYGRLLAWIWVDGKLLQEDITKEGLVEDFYDYGTYRYETKIRTAMTYARNYHKGMYR